MHLLYALISILLVGLFSTSMFRSIRHSENKMVLNEVLTELTGVGYDVLEFIGRRAYDENTDESKKSPLSYPVITNESFLTASGSFGGCVALTLVNPSCDDVDDFHGLTFTKTSGGLDYEVSVAVTYVNVTNGQPTTFKKYGKEVTVTVTSPYLLVGGEPLEVTLSRIFTYQRHTTAP